MYVRIEIEWGNDALDGRTVVAHQQEVFAAVGQAVGHGLDQGAVQIAVDGTPFPINARFRRALFGPGERPSMPGDAVTAGGNGS
jgi:hypothetical protein